MTEFAPKVSNAVAEKDKAETFAESDVTLTHSKTAVSGESIQLDATEDYPAMDTDITNTSAGNEFGVIINPNEEISTLRGQLTTVNMSGTFHVRLRLQSDGTLIDDVTGLSGGDTFSMTGLSLSAGTEYRVTVTDDSNNFDASYVDNYSFPLSGAAFDTVDGWNGSLKSDLFIIDWLAPGKPTSGTVYVEWPMPNDVYAWDSATFQRTLDGESVDVYLEEDDGGWTEVAGPIARGDDIPADPSNNVRFRIDISRGGTANNPTLDAIYRRWKL